MFTKANKALVVTFIFTLFLFAGCTANISNSEIATKVEKLLEGNYAKDYLAMPALGYSGKIEFDEFFKLVKVTVKDKLIKDKQMKVKCNVTVHVIKKYGRDSGITRAWSIVVGSSAGVVGQKKSNDVKFLFEKYESGWRIEKILT